MVVGIVFAVVVSTTVVFISGKVAIIFSVAAEVAFLSSMTSVVEDTFTTVNALPVAGVVDNNCSVIVSADDTETVGGCVVSSSK